MTSLPAPLVITKGTCFPLFAYDVARAIDLDVAERRLLASAERQTIKHKRRAPAYFEYRPPPLRVTRGGEAHELAGYRAAPAGRILPTRMLHYFKFRQELFDPEPGREVYRKPGAGKGWPEECPPIRAGNAFGFDLVANFDVTFVRRRDGSWRAEPDVVIESDFDYAGSDESSGAPLTQQYPGSGRRGRSCRT